MPSPNDAPDIDTSNAAWPGGVTNNRGDTDEESRIGLIRGMTACAVEPAGQPDPLDQEKPLATGEQATPRGEALGRREQSLEATTSCTISQNSSGQIVFTPATLQVNPGDFVQFTTTNAAGTLTLPATIFVDTGPLTLAPNTPTTGVKIQVLPDLLPNASGTSGFASSLLGIAGTITIGTGSGPGITPPQGPLGLNGSIPIGTGPGVTQPQGPENGSSDTPLDLNGSIPIGTGPGVTQPQGPENGSSDTPLDLNGSIPIGTGFGPG